MIPPDLADYLLTTQSLNYVGEAAPIELYKADEIPLLDIYIDPNDGNVYDDIAPQEVRGKKVRYEVEVFDLVKTATNYPADGILFYISKLRRYGSWDCDHWIGYLFPENINWQDILADPSKYLNVQWSYLPEFEYFKPWEFGYKVSDWN